MTAGLIGGEYAAWTIAVAGFITTEVACVLAWRDLRRPRLFRLVVVPFAQMMALFTAVEATISPGITSSELGRAFIVLFFCGLYVFFSCLWAGLARQAEFATHGSTPSWSPEARRRALQRRREANDGGEIP